MNNSAYEKRSTRPSRGPAFVLAGIIVVALVVRFYLMISTGSTSEDFYITLRYAENLAHGNGLVYNVGERVLGTTTPLYTLFLALIAWLGLDAATFGKIVNILADGLSCYLIWRLGRRVKQAGAGLIAASLFALSPPNLTWAISGMETSLVTACTLGFFVAVTERKLHFVAISGALLYLLRIDGLLAVAVGYGALFWSGRRDGDIRGVAKSAGLFLLLCAPWTLFAWAYYGSPIPASVIAKLTVYAWLSKGALPNLSPFVEQMTHTKIHLFVLFGALIGCAVAVISLRPLRPVIGWMWVYFAAMAFSKGFLFGWYYVPPSGIYFLLAVLGYGWIVRWIAGKMTNDNQQTIESSPTPVIGPDLSLRLAIILLAVGIVRLPTINADLVAAQEVEELLRKPIGNDLRSLIRPGERLMLEPIGYIGYFSRAKILDAVGLVSPEVVPYYHEGAVSPYLDLMHDLKPEWVLLRAGEFEEARHANVPADRALHAHYRIVKNYSNVFDLQSANSPPAFILFRRF